MTCMRRKDSRVQPSSGEAWRHIGTANIYEINITDTGTSASGYSKSPFTSWKYQFIGVRMLVIAHTAVMSEPPSLWRLKGFTAPESDRSFATG